MTNTLQDALGTEYQVRHRAKHATKQRARMHYVQKRELRQRRKDASRVKHVRPRGPEAALPVMSKKSMIQHRFVMRLCK